MSKGKSQILRLPGEATRELWQREGTGTWTLVGKDDGTPGGFFGIEAIALDSAPFWGKVMPDSQGSLESTASLRWEALGVATEGEGQSWAHWTVSEEEGQTLVGTVALAADAPQAEWAEHAPATFEISAQLYPIPNSELAVWKELERYVVAFHRGDHLLHSAVLSSRELDAGAVEELRGLIMSLEVSGLLPKLKGVRVWAEAGPEFVALVKSELGLKAKLENKPAPRLPEEASGLLPPVVAQLRVERKRRAQQTQLLVLAAMVYVGFFAAWSGWLFWKDHQVNQSVVALNAKQPEVDAVREAQLRWSALEAATDPDTYPAEVFHQVVSLLPDEGIRLKEFSIDTDKLVIGGEASTVNHALKFKADLEANEALNRFAWVFPQPTIMEDNRANFRGEGLINEGGSADEGE
jgi:hypothetical protein